MMPYPTVRTVTTTKFFDASHASNMATIRSCTGFILFDNRASIFQFIQKQNTVKLSTFKIDYIALKTCGEQITAYTVQGPISESTKLLDGNESVAGDY